MKHKGIVVEIAPKNKVIIMTPQGSFSRSLSVNTFKWGRRFVILPVRNASTPGSWLLLRCCSWPSWAAGP